MLYELLDKGEIVEIRSNDILTQALGTPEHPGRVRGRGKFVAQREVFKKPVKDLENYKNVNFTMRDKETKHGRKQLVS